MVGWAVVEKALSLEKDAILAPEHAEWLRQLGEAEHADAEEAPR